MQRFLQEKACPYGAHAPGRPAINTSQAVLAVSLYICCIFYSLSPIALSLMSVQVMALATAAAISVAAIWQNLTKPVLIACIFATTVAHWLAVRGVLLDTGLEGQPYRNPLMREIAQFAVLPAVILCRIRIARLTRHWLIKGNLAAFALLLAIGFSALVLRPLLY